MNKAEQCLEKENQQLGTRVWQSSVLVSPTTTSNRDAVPIGDDIEPVGESRVDVKTGNKGEEESLEVGIPTFEVIQKKRKTRIRRLWTTGVGVVFVSKIVVQGNHLQVEPLEKEGRERTKSSWVSETTLACENEPSLEVFQEAKIYSRVEAVVRITDDIPQ